MSTLGFGPMLLEKFPEKVCLVGGDLSRAYDEMQDVEMADEKKIDELLNADMSESRKCNVRGTPTVLINGLRLSGRNIEDYKARIDQIIAKDKQK
jgi:protein-disulfide isomerase